MAFFESEKKGSVLEILLTRPEAHNALNAEMISGLTKIFKSVSQDTGIAAVKLRGAGPSFCAGGDLNWMRQSLNYSLKQNIADAGKLAAMCEALFLCPAPVVAVVQGSVMGGGVGLAAICDIVAAETATKFCLSEVRLGLVPSIISPYLLRKIPESEARLLMLTAEVFGAPYAQKIGLAQFSGSLTDCENYINGKLEMILQNGLEATRATKTLIQKVKTSSWNEARKTTVTTIAKRRVSKEGQEGMNAFFEKRKPVWRKEDGP